MCKTPFAHTHGLCMNDVLENDTEVQLYGTAYSKVNVTFHMNIPETPAPFTFRQESKFANVLF